MADVNRGDRPLSPHLQVYRPQITSVLSILHRITGVRLDRQHAAVGVVVLRWRVERGGFRRRRGGVAQPGRHRRADRQRFRPRLSHLQRRPAPVLGRWLRLRPRQRDHKRLGGADRRRGGDRGVLLLIAVA